MQIDGGTVCVGGLTLALPISGPGYLRVLYTSPAIRILTSLTRRASLVEPPRVAMCLTLAPSI